MPGVSKIITNLGRDLALLIIPVAVVLLLATLKPKVAEKVAD